MFCFEKYKLLAKTPLQFCKDSPITGIDGWGRNFFSEFSNPPLSTHIASYVNARQKIMQVSIGVNSFPPPTAKNIHISYL